MDERRTITIDLWKAVAILVTAVISSAGVGLWGGISTLNSDHYALATNIKDVETLKQTQKEIVISLTKMNTTLSRIEGQLSVTK